MDSMPFTGTDEIHMRAPTCKYADSKSGFNDMVGIEIRYRQGNLAVFFYFGGVAAFSHHCLPHGRRGIASAALGYLQIADLRCFFSLVFMPLEPYPARFARHLPHGGRLTIRDMLFFHLFSCPPGCFCFLPSYSPVFPCASKISRFARNDDTGEAVFSFR